MRLSVLAVLSLLMVATGCEKKQTSPPAGKIYECDTDEQCGKGQICAAHACAPDDEETVAEPAPVKVPGAGADEPVAAPTAEGP